MKKLVSIFALCTFVFVGALNAQTSKTTKTTKATEKAQKEVVEKAKLLKYEEGNLAMITNSNFTFYPNMVEPEFGITHFVDCDCYLQVFKESLLAQLPFLGNFYVTQRPMGLEPAQFISDNFTYDFSTTDGITYNVVITPQGAIADMNDGLTLNFNLNIRNGNATLVITTDMTDSITYSGYFQ